MLLSLSSDQQLFRDTTARMLAERVPLSRLRQMRADPAGYEAEYWRAGAELGWTALLVDEAQGGGSLSGQGAVDLSLVAYEFGRHAAPGPLVEVNLVAQALSGRDGDLQRAVLADLLSGAAVAACCQGAPPWREPKEATVQIRRDGADVVIDGAVRPVESAGQAAHLLVTGRSETGVTQVLVPRETAGVSIKPLRSLDVTRRFAAVGFEAVRAPAQAVVGEFGGAEAQAARQAQLAAVLLAAESTGAMDAAFEMTLQWAFERYTFGRPLAAYQALKHRFADMKSWLEAAHAVSDAAAAALSDGAADAAELASAAKAFTGEYGVELAQDCVQLHGGIGVTYEHDLHFFLRRVTLDRTLYGTPADHRQSLAAISLGQELAA
jgi:alkylation response protein AidB-like acyl-CoA dehydrogenase